MLTLLVGSVLAIAQKDLKRMLAYSSISQAGYVLVGVQAASANGNSGALFYLFTYTFIIIGTFAVVSIVGGQGEARNDLASIRGLSTRRPALAGLMIVFLLAQAGVPFTTGFLAKFYVVSAAVDRGQYALAIIAMLAAAVAAFFYLRLAIVMYGSPADAAALGSAMGTSMRTAMRGMGPGRERGRGRGHGGGAGGDLPPRHPCSGRGRSLPLRRVHHRCGLAPAPVIDLAKQATLLF